MQKVKPLTGDEILAYVKKMGESVNLVTYPQLAQVNSIDQLFGDKTAVILLYNVLARNNGHWVLLLKHKPNCHQCSKYGSNRGEGGMRCPQGVIEFFDPYGKAIDFILTFQSSDKRATLGQSQFKLAHLLGSSPYCIVFNDKPVQKRSPSIVTCGHHCMARLNNRHFHVDDYVSRLKSLGGNTDETVADMYYQ